jgi:uncharacterized protein
MKNVCRHRFTIMGMLFVLILGGCGSTQPSRFYTLGSIGKYEAGTRSTSADQIIFVTIGPVDIPDYLDRPQIVSRTSKNELSLSEFDRWAGSLKDDTVRVISENLTDLLSQNSAFVSPWGRGTGGDYRVIIDIMRFDAMPEGNILLNAQWTIVGKEGKQVLRTRESVITESVSAQTYDAKVSAMSGALEKLSRDIAEGIKAILQKNK